MAVQEGFGRLGRKCRHKAIIGVRQVHRKVVRLLLHTGNHHQRFAEVGLRLTRGMGQRNKHLPAANLFATHIVLHDRVAAREAVLVLEPIEDPLGRVPLLQRPLLVVCNNGVDHAYPRPSLGRLIGCWRW
jgi:hypothetical protein